MGRRVNLNLAVIFGALSDYHVVRIESAERLLKKYGYRLTLVERVGRQTDYPWFGGLNSSKIIIRKAYETKNFSPSNHESATKLWKTEK